MTENLTTVVVIAGLVSTILTSLVAWLTQLSRSARMRKISDWARQQQARSEPTQKQNLISLQRWAEGRVLADTVVSGKAYFWALYSLALPIIIDATYFLDLRQSRIEYSGIEHRLWAIWLWTLVLWFWFTTAEGTASARQKVAVDHLADRPLEIPPLTLKSRWKKYGCREAKNGLSLSLSCTSLFTGIWFSMPALAGVSADASTLGATLLIAGVVSLGLILEKRLPSTRIFPGGESNSGRKSRPSNSNQPSNLDRFKKYWKQLSQSGIFRRY